MSRASLIQRAIELQKLVKDSRAVLSLAAGEEATSDILGLLEEIIRRTGEFLSSGNENIEDYRRLQVLMNEARRLLDMAIRGQGNPPLRKVEEDDEQSQDEVPASDDEKSPQSDFAVSIVPRRTKKGDEDQSIDVGDSEQESDDNDSQARWPSANPNAQRGKAAHSLVAKSLSQDVIDGLVKARLSGIVSGNDLMKALLPGVRRKKDSARLQVKGG